MERQGWAAPWGRPAPTEVAGTIQAIWPAADRIATDPVQFAAVESQVEGRVHGRIDHDRSTVSGGNVQAIEYRHRGVALNRQRPQGSDPGSESEIDVAQG